jgi:hypothetical protein
VSKFVLRESLISSQTNSLIDLSVFSVEGTKESIFGLERPKLPTNPAADPPYLYGD